MDFSQTTFKDHLRVHCKPAYQRQNKDHYKDNLLTYMQVFGNANGLFIRKLISKTV
ncbi:MAG: hypothetical protein NTV78_01080 [Caldiserica bacterium]|nr:hypothetical protein [Caldisericota bacterium]